MFRVPVRSRVLASPLHQQNEHRNAGRRHRQKPLPDPRNEMNGVHVFTPFNSAVARCLRRRWGILREILQALTRYSANDPEFPVNDRQIC